MSERSIFLAALEIDDTAQRADYLAKACANDAAMRNRVEELLKAHQQPGGFMGRPAPSLVDPSEPWSTGEGPGTVIGPYKLLEQIGEGGFGVVFLAEQSHPLRRKIALKVLKPGMDTRQVVARFEAERQVLALMDHPNIARVFDGGATPSGRPYFVMELVRGVPITEYCDTNHFSPRQRLELFVSVCMAVQHAHQKGVIHRDIKPNNVLVSRHDTTPVVKVIDFGVAKALGQVLTDKTLFTGISQLVGTPLYMSPEQAGMSDLDVDTRSDVYSLGVLLYELLTGTTPFDQERFRTVGYDEMRRIIREEEPARPSTRLSTLGQAAATVSANRGSDPKHLSRLIRGELDWVVMKALEKDRNRRYESASALAADLHRHLHDEPVQACPPSTLYRVRKFVRRNRAPVLAASLLALALVGGIVGTTLGLVRATVAEARAVNEAGKRETALKERELALIESQDRLFQTLVQQAGAARTSGRVGQRFEALEAVRKAAAIRVTPELRAEAAAALALPDAEVLQEWAGWPEGSVRVAFDPDYSRYARLDRHGEITVCQVRDGREEIVTRLPTRAKPSFGTLTFGTLKLSRGGRYLVYGEGLTGGSMAARAWVWKLDGPKPELLFEVAVGMSRFAVCFHANGQFLAIGHADQTISVYDLSAGKRVRQIAVGATPFDLDFHPRDGRLAVVCHDTVKVFNADARELATLSHKGTEVGSAAWHPDGRMLATGAHDHKIRLWDTETATETLPPLEAPGRSGLTVIFSRTGDRLLSWGWSTATVLWDPFSGRRLLTLPHTSGLFGPDDRILGWGISGHNLQIWGLTDGRELQVFRCRKEASPHVLAHSVVDATGRVLCANTRLRLNFYNLESGKELASARLPRADAACPVFFEPPRRFGSPQNELGEAAGTLVTGGHSGLYLWPARMAPARHGVMSIGPPRQLIPDESRAGYANRTGFSSDGRLVAVPQGAATLLLHRERPDWRLVLGPQHDVRKAAVSPDGRWVATCSWWPDHRSKSVRIWDVTTGRQVHEMLEGESLAQFSPDGSWLMTGSGSGTQMWEVETWREVRRFPLVAFVFSPDNRLIAIGDVHNGIQLLELTSGREVARLTGPDPGFYKPECFTPNGTRLVATGPAGVYVWDLRSIRRQLKDLGLDWDWPEFPPPDSSDRGSGLLAVEVNLGELDQRMGNREERTRAEIEYNRRLLAVNPDNPTACNNLAWHFATAPEPIRDVKAAVPLAERAVKHAPKNPVYVNTLGVAYYRIERYREAAELLRANLANSEDANLAHDLYFLAMCHHRLGEKARARDYFDLAERWMRTQRDLANDDLDELGEFRAEARMLLGIATEVAPSPREKKEL